jgi:hypothetical protein
MIAAISLPYGEAVEIPAPLALPKMAAIYFSTSCLDFFLLAFYLT